MCNVGERETPKRKPCIFFYHDCINNVWPCPLREANNCKTAEEENQDKKARNERSLWAGY